jgi:uncharacterized damage-inducible protein DinB
MTTQAPDPTLDRLFRHMAWANARLIARLRELDDAALGLSAPGNEWTVAMIVEHIVGAAGGYAARLEGTPRPPRPDPPATVAELSAMADTLAHLDARLRAAAAAPDAILEWDSSVGGQHRARSTILAQAIHHATEHRAQIAGALAANGRDAIDLDALDLWSYGSAEGLGA